MRISVIVSTYTLGRLVDVRRCLESIRAQTRPADEVVLVLDPVPELIAGYRDALGSQVQIVIARDRGLSAARNAGMQSTTGEIIAFIDDDAFAAADWLERLEAAFSEPNVLCVGGRIDAWWPEGRPTWFPDEIDWVVGCTYKGHAEQRGEIRNAIGANMAFRREVVNLVPEGFRTDIGRVGKVLLGSEEMEFCIKVKERLATARILYEPRAVVQHHVPASRGRLGYVLRRAYGEGVSKRRLRSSSLERSNAALSSESSYLRFLGKRAVIGRLARPRLRSLRQMGTIFLTVLATGAGYVFGR